MQYATTRRKLQRRPLLGTVEANGAVYFYGGINECRLFLRQHGLEIDPKRGWISRTHAGIIHFDSQRSSYYAAYWGHE